MLLPGRVEPLSCTPYTHGGVGPWGPYEVTHKRAKGRQSALLGLPGSEPQGCDLF